MNPRYRSFNEAKYALLFYLNSVFHFLFSTHFARLDEGADPNTLPICQAQLLPLFVSLTTFTHTGPKNLISSCSILSKFILKFIIDSVSYPKIPLGFSFFSQTVSQRP